MLAKIDVINPLCKNAILGFSLDGNGVYSQEQVAAVIKQANKFREYIIVLHGSEQQCAMWLKKNEISLQTLKEGTRIFSWKELLEIPDCQIQIKKFIEVYGQNADYKKAIDETVVLYTKRHSQESLNVDMVKDFILQEMAVLTWLAISKKTDCFVYKGVELPAFYATKKYFFIGPNQNLLQWAELSFAEEKKKKKKPSFFSEPSASAGSDIVYDSDKILAIMLRMQEINRLTQNLTFQIGVASLQKKNGAIFPVIVKEFAPLPKLMADLQRDIELLQKETSLGQEEEHSTKKKTRNVINLYSVIFNFLKH